MQKMSFPNWLAVRPLVPVVALLLGLVAAPVSGTEAGNVSRDMLAGLVAEALANNLDIQSLEERAEALRSEAPFAGSLQDPRLSLAILNLPTDSFDFDQEAMTQKQVAIAQKIPWFGTLDLAEQGAELGALAMEKQVEAEKLAVVRKLKDSWFELGLVEKRIEINDKLSAIVSQVLKIAETRYTTGEGLQQDILLAQVQMSELLDERIMLAGRKQGLRDDIGALLNRSELFTASGPTVIMPDLTWIDRERLTQLALKANPLIGARRAGVMRAQVNVELAEKKYLPDMDFRISYGQREDDPVSGSNRADFFSAGVTLTIPLWQSTRQDSKLAGSERRLAGAKKSLQALQRALPHRIDGIIAQLQAMQENSKFVFDALAGQAEGLADASLAAYSVGKVEFSTMLSSRMRLLQIELKGLRYTYRMHKKLAELEEAVGLPIELIKEKQ